MNDLIHADVFFFITSIAVIVLGLGMAVAMFYVVAILRDLREIVGKVRRASDHIEQDFEELRSQIKAEGARVRTIVDLVVGMVSRKMPLRRKKKADPEDNIT